MISVVVLGTTASLPTKNATPSCFAVKHGGNYLFDCCEGCQRQCMALGVSIMKIQAVFISHLHADHFLGLFGLMQSMNILQRTAPLAIITPIGGKKLLETVFGFKPLQVNYPVIIKEAGKRSGKVYANDLFTVTAFPVKHAPNAVGYCLETPAYRRFNEAKAKSLGVRGRLFSELQEKGRVKINGKTIRLADVTYLQKGKKLVYSGDTLPCPAVLRFAKGADLLVHEATFATGEEKTAAEKKHSTARQAAAIAAKAKCKKLLLTHFSNRYEDTAALLKEARGEFQNAELAREGLELSV